ncbi:NAD-dependent epimerase/dehydratase [Fonsecaea pedrosoi]|nr:NAD-dependent epimerase/dehydratase [Fonsecaea pedrosoi]
MSNPRRLENRNAIVTGSSSGLGAAISLALSSHGASIFCIDLYPTPRNAINSNTNRADDIHNRTRDQSGTHERIRQLGSEATYHKADVTRARDIELAIRACVAKYKRVDIMVNNAGISVESTHLRPLRCHETSEEDFDRTLAINTKGMFLGCKYALKQMLDLQPSCTARAAGSSTSPASRAWCRTAARRATVPRKAPPSC